MTRITWGDLENRNYEYGVDRGVFYPKNGVGVAWSGLVSVNESTIDASQSLIYVDGVGHENHLLIGSFAATIEAVTYPQEFEPFDGYLDLYSGQRRRTFDFCYRTMQDSGYKLHLVYNAFATVTERNNSTLNGDTDIQLFSWGVTTRPEVVEGAKASSHFVIDSTLVYPGIMELIENRVYGTGFNQADMPTVPELLNIFWDNALFRVTLNGDGTATIFGDDNAVALIGTDLWQLTWPSVIQLNPTTYKASSF